MKMGRKIFQLKQFCLGSVKFHKSYDIYIIECINKIHNKYLNNKKIITSRKNIQYITNILIKYQILTYYYIKCTIYKNRNRNIIKYIKINTNTLT